MKKFVFNRILACALMGMAFSPLVIQAEDCSREMLISFYYPDFVKTALEKYNVPKDKWDAIVNDLSAKDKDVIKQIEQKASSMNPNPLKERGEHQAAMKLLNEVTYQIFSDSLKANGVTDDKQIRQIFDEVHQQKIKKCVPWQSSPQVRPQVAKPPQTKNKDALQDDDDDFDDDDEHHFSTSKPASK